jgi:peptidoglycan/xylan/chitin deacetylase (PgdA/CDA1 family)
MSDASRFNEAAEAFSRSMENGPLIRAVNFHNTPRTRAEEFREQLARLSRSYSPVNESDLDRYLATGRWHKAKPGVIVAFYEGYRNGYDVILPLLEEFGLVGWFMVITGFIEAPAAEQVNFAKAHDIGLATPEYTDGRHALSWNELREIDRRHVVASHARSHVWLDKLDDAARESEIVGSQEDFQRHLGHPVRTFVSYGGPPYGSDGRTDTLIDRAGYQFVFSNLKIQRLRESNAAVAR